MQYILNIRINNAVSLLETTDYNVTEISAIVGYDNHSSQNENGNACAGQ